MDEDELDAATGVASLTPTSDGAPSIESLGGASRRFLASLQGATEALKRDARSSARAAGTRENPAASGLLERSAKLDGIGGAFAGLLASGSAPGGGGGGLSASGAFARALNGGDAAARASPDSLFGGNFGALTPTGLSFGGLQLPSPNASGHLNVDLGSMDLPSPVARALAAGAGDIRQAQVYLASSLAGWLREQKTDGSGRPYGECKDEDPTLRKHFTRAQILAIRAFGELDAA